MGHNVGHIYIAKWRGWIEGASATSGTRAAMNDSFLERVEPGATSESQRRAAEELVPTRARKGL